MASTRFCGASLQLASSCLVSLMEQSRTSLPFYQQIYLNSLDTSFEIVGDSVAHLINSQNSQELFPSCFNGKEKAEYAQN